MLKVKVKVKYPFEISMSKNIMLATNCKQSKQEQVKTTNRITQNSVFKHQTPNIPLHIIPCYLPLVKEVI